MIVIGEGGVSACWILDSEGVILMVLSYIILASEATICCVLRSLGMVAVCQKQDF